MATSYARELAELRHAYESHVEPLLHDGLVAGRKLIAKAPLPRKKSGVGGFIAAGFAVALVAGAAYVAWQVLRTDDQAWVDDEFDVD
jgi:hypothetical protein